MKKKRVLFQTQRRRSALTMRGYRLAEYLNTDIVPGYPEPDFDCTVKVANPPHWGADGELEYDANILINDTISNTVNKLSKIINFHLFLDKINKDISNYKIL